jgi:hypothetical protein
MSFRHFVVALIICSGAFAWIQHAQHIMVAQKGRISNEELLYYPNEKLLRHFTGGLGNVVADFMWLRTIKYMSQEFDERRRKFEWLEHMAHSVTNLDPYFKDAYSHGGLFLAAVGEDEKALKLLKKGFIANPDSVEIPKEIARTYVLNRRNDPVTPTIVPHYLRMVAERHEHPEMYLQWARRIQEDHSITQQSKEMWWEMMQSASNEMIRDLAARNYYLLLAQERVELMRSAADEYTVEVGRRPDRLTDLVERGLLASLPADPVEGEYYLDSSGEVRNSLLQQDLKRRMLISLNVTVNRFRREQGRNPHSLDELQAKLDVRLPDHPVEGEEWNYDPIEGRIN